MWTEKDFLANKLQAKKLRKCNISQLCFLDYKLLAFQLENQGPNDIKTAIISAKEDLYFLSNMWSVNTYMWFKLVNIFIYFTF